LTAASRSCTWSRSPLRTPASCSTCSLALTALIAVVEEASRDLPALAWDALANAATVAYQSGTPASQQAVSRTLDLLERQDPPPTGRGPRVDVNVLKLQIRASMDPTGSRDQLIPLPAHDRRRAA
jgi:hypothetical protein